MLPFLEQARERCIVQKVIEEFGLPQLPADSTITYAYHNDQFVLEWYGFEIQTTSEQAEKWKTETDDLNLRKKLGNGFIDFDCKLRNSYYVEVRLFESHK